MDTPHLNEAENPPQADVSQNVSSPNSAAVDGPSHPSAISQTKPEKLAPPEENRLRGLRGSLGLLCAAETVWRDMLNEQERLRIGPDFQSAVNKVGLNGGALYQAAKGCSRNTATLDVVVALELIGRLEHLRLRRFVDEKEGRDVTLKRKRLSADIVSTMDMVAKARAKFELLIIVGENLRGVFWKQSLCDTPWEKCLESWEFILKLCRACEHGRRCQPDDFGEDDSRDTMSSKKYNLKRQGYTPTELADTIRIESGEQDVVYLDLPKEKVHVMNVGRSLSNEDLRLI